MAETSTIFGFMKYVSATDILSDFKKTVDSYFVNSLKGINCIVDSFFLFGFYCLMTGSFICFIKVFINDSATIIFMILKMIYKFETFAMV